MSAGILELPEVRDLIPHVSVEDYERMGEMGVISRRTELIRGIIIKKMSGSPLHASIATRLFKRVLVLLPAGYTARQEQPLRFRDSEPEPDLAIVQGDDRDFSTQHPTTADPVVEIAISSVTIDRANATLYAENGVQEYWIVLPAQKTIEVYRGLENGAYREQVSVTDEETIVCASRPEIRFRVAEILS